MSIESCETKGVDGDNVEYMPNVGRIMTEKRMVDDEGEILQNIDILEDLNFHFDRKILDILLLDRTSRRNILWATTDYESIGAGYEEFSQIAPDRIVGRHSILIQPRVAKSLDSQTDRTRNRAEVFTPCWVCNKQNNLVDAQWFGEMNIFNTATDTGWVATKGKISFPNSKKTWKRYINAPRMEISCGEAPYLVSRYDVVTGEKIATEQRIGILAETEYLSFYLLQNPWTHHPFVRLPTEHCDIPYML